MITRHDLQLDPQVMSDIIEGVVSKSTVLQIFRRLPNMSTGKMKMRVLDALPVAYWVDAKTDNGRKKLTKQAWDNKFITAEEIAVIVPIKQDLLDDADFDIWASVKPRLIEAFGKKIDDAILLGVDRPNGFRADLVTSVINAGAEVTPASGDTLYKSINDAMVKVEESGYEPNAIVGGIDIKGKFRMMVDSTGQPIKGTEIDQITKHYVTNGAWDKTKSQLIVGDFSQAVYSIRQDIEFKLLEEAIIQDPTTGDILYNLAQEDMVALRVTMRLGWEIPNPINALQPDGSKRFPFASIKPSNQNLGLTTVTLTITDSETVPNNLENVKATLGSVTKYTNASGVATASFHPGDYEYTIKKSGYKTITGVLTVGSEAIEQTIAMEAK